VSQRCSRNIIILYRLLSSVFPELKAIVTGQLEVWWEGLVNTLGGNVVGVKPLKSGSWNSNDCSCPSRAQSLYIIMPLALWFLSSNSFAVSTHSPSPNHCVKNPILQSMQHIYSNQLYHDFFSTTHFVSNHLANLTIGESTALQNRSATNMMNGK